MFLFKELGKGEIQKLNATNEELNLIMFELFKNIYKKNKKYTNDEFINIFENDGKFINIADEIGGISNYGRGIIVQGDAGQLINGEANITMKINRMSLCFMYRNSSWKTI